MNNFELLESIGSVDEVLLEEAETFHYTHKRFGLKVLLVAAIIAMLSITAAAVIKYGFTDVSGGEVEPATFKITTTDSEWNVVQIGTTPGYLVNADIETFEDVPMKLMYPYLPAVPDSWTCNGAGHAKYDGEIGMAGINWTYQLDGMEYEVFYRQESAYFYNTGDTRTVWWLDHLPRDVTVTGQSTSIGDATVYRVEVSGSADRNFYTYARSLIFWSNGYSIFQLAAPSYMTDAEIFELMCSLSLQQDMELAISHLK